MGRAEAAAMILGLALFWAAGLGDAAPNLPRLRLSFQELQARHGVRTFRLERTCCYEALLVDEERGRLFVGAENHVASLSLDNISKRAKKLAWPAPVEWREECNWAGKDIGTECMNFVKLLHVYNHTHLLACGTGAFHPTCAFVEVGHRLEEPVLRLDLRKLEDGKGKSPYDPRHRAASVLVGEELYSGVAADLMGRDFTIFRSLGPNPSLRTEPHDSRWLNEPKFVKVFWIPESENPDDDKIYFFFRESAVEAAPAMGRMTVSRVGQICRNDLGGQRSLVNKWTTFLKARLVCSVPGVEGDTHFDQLQDAFLLSSRDRQASLLYAVFSTSSGVFQGSAVCVYSMNDVRRAFLGPFAHKEGPTHQWVSYQGRVPYPRPGMCPSKTFGTFSSTKDFPDDVIQFARNHPLMYNSVLPMGGRPLFLQVGAGYTFTQIAADRVAAADGHYDVLFIGTDVGTVLKVISVPKGSRPNSEGLLLEELQVFEDSATVTSMQISSKRNQLYVASPSAVAQIALHRCTALGRACAECCLARDPYCAWDGSACTRFQPTAKRRFRRQDIRNGDPSTQCPGDSPHSALLERKVLGVESGSAFLECEPRSLQAHVEWTFQRAGEAAHTQVLAEDRVERTARGLLLHGLRRQDSGVYLCVAVEQGFSQPLRRLVLHVLSAVPAERLARAEEAVAPAPAGPKLWYRDFLQLVEPGGGGGASSLRMCRPQPGPHPAPSESRRKGRNRRTHVSELRAERGPRSAAHW
ncbi:semaphorin-3B isoform X1 [Meriones unguiculatus]|uniref:semaphorin-3B isoform X1 n=2 Tax=Meriones unguiculatus TaxID=10047 RepID=UPI000B4F189D|nr:semaphorin-3B isoform X1 [Meriones unguiculatus]XP_021517907.1 semaphorin-3B isoform X1 [Meriones unguiculatus]XP_021517915.1 semaphorin-3B isoform X1 [Meriones unguiculatus]XP_021517922.1 semaphorin-3B isoform X1 [Meriones unguiculatus]XP_021517929.1 semaphorin-3B isoform X1 [Meriones unguiculatus]XP_021517936.1 semaphorin-3B isoform X1 [Meriones unguiculatus]XP_021517942.1 semaphorin-3B isoform X1 [Meriones unguiculatus]XP_021517949.1 semaphorin-3B isoform X1 [Meriones unguiculatus]XP_